MLVCALGDLTLDVVVLLRTVVSPRADTHADIRVVAGGQAANVAAWSAALGARARYIGKRGADSAGILAADGLRRLGVEVHGPASGRSGIVCSLVEAGGERSMLTDRGAAVELRPDELDADWFSGCSDLYVSGYALLREPVRAAAAAAVDLAREEGARVSVDLASWSAIRDSGPAAFRASLAQLAPDVVFANEDEDEIVGGPLPGATWILTHGPRGCSFGADERAALPVEEVIDTTGAGDALAAGFLVGGPDLALEAAARCIQHTGAMPLGSEP